MDEQTTNEAAAAGPEQTPPQAEQVIEVQITSAAPDATVTVEQLQATAEPAAEAPPPPDRNLAVEMVTRFLGHQGITAREMVAELNDDEARAVILAGGDRFTARVQIKSVFSRAYDRRRDEAEKSQPRQAADSPEPVAIGSDPNAGKEHAGHSEQGEAPAGVAPDAKVEENTKGKPGKSA